MSVEHLTPGGLNGYDDFESVASDILPELFDEINSNIDEGNSIFDEDFELNNIQILNITESFSKLLYNDEDEVNHNEVIATSHRALLFGMMLSHELNPSLQWKGDDLGQLAKDIENKEVQEFISNTSSNYLQRRDSIDTLIASYMPEISPDSRYAIGAETIIAFTLSQAEEYSLNDFIDQQVDEFVIDESLNDN